MFFMEPHTMTARVAMQVLMDVHADSRTRVLLSYIFLPEEIVAYAFATHSLVTAGPSIACEDLRQGCSRDGPFIRRAVHGHFPDGAFGS